MLVSKTSGPLFRSLVARPNRCGHSYGWCRHTRNHTLARKRWESLTHWVRLRPVHISWAAALATPNAASAHAHAHARTLTHTHTRSLSLSLSHTHTTTHTHKYTTQDAATCRYMDMGTLACAFLPQVAGAQASTVRSLCVPINRGQALAVRLGHAPRFAPAGDAYAETVRSLCFRMWLPPKTDLFCRLATLYAEAMAKPSTASL